MKVDLLENLKATYDKLLQTNQAATSFIKEIESGNLHASFQGSAETADELTVALLAMQHQLQKIAEEEKERNWATQGMVVGNGITGTLYGKEPNSLGHFKNIAFGYLFIYYHCNGFWFTYTYNRLRIGLAKRAAFMGDVDHFLVKKIR